MSNSIHKSNLSPKEFNLLSNLPVKQAGVGSSSWVDVLESRVRHS